VQRLQQQIAKGQQLLDTPITSIGDVKRIRDAYLEWTAYNTELLKRIFDNESVAREYDFWLMATAGPNDFEPLSAHIKDIHDDIAEKIARLRRILGRLDLIPEASAPTTQRAAEGSQSRRSARSIQHINIHGGTVNIAQTATGNIAQTTAATNELADIRRQLRELEDAIRAVQGPSEYSNHSRAA
jgi:hypothetical protein